MKKIISLLLFLIVLQIQAQRIRKNHKEMTPNEKTSYVSALNTLFSVGKIYNPNNFSDLNTFLGIHNVAGANGIHNTMQFLSWHRIFQTQMEEEIRAVSSNFNATIPYWNWLEENTATNIFWDDADFLSQSFISSKGLDPRNPMTTVLGGNFTTIYTIPSIMSQTDSNLFRTRLEGGYHNTGHGWVGGFMNSPATSPGDPVFFLHHGNIDRLWQEWEDQESAQKTNFTLTVSTTWPSINPNTITDSRYTKYKHGDHGGIEHIEEVDVWYAKNKILILDGLNGNFSTGNTIKTYIYQAWNGTSVEGTIYAGDLQRDSSDNVIADNKGGFIVSSDSYCDFVAGKAIVMKPGFLVNSGALFSAAINANQLVFNVVSPETPIISRTNSIKSVNSLNILPNPSNGIFKISLNDISEGNIEISDLYGFTIHKSDFKNQTEFEMNLQDRPKGIYIVKVFSGEQVFTSKIIKN